MKLHLDCIIFVNQESHALLTQMYPETSRRRYIIKEFKDFYTSKWDWSYDQSIDHESSIGHNSLLYQIWNEKIFFVNEAIELLPVYDYYIWMDIGSMRKSQDIARIRTFPYVKNPAKAVTFSQIQEFTVEDEKNLTQIDERFRYVCRISGSMFGGDVDSLKKFKKVHEETIQEFKDLKVFAGKDQNLYAFEYLRNKELFYLHKNMDSTIESWFALQYLWS